jgi:thiol-disulfide isomerase/thioredoxin
MLLQRTSDTSKINRFSTLCDLSWLWCCALIVLIACSCIGCAVVSSGTTELVGKPVPWSRLMLLDGTQVPLTPDAGNIHVVLFWASWCPRSRYVVEDYERLAHRLGGHDRLSFFAVSIDKNEDFETLKRRIDSQGLHSIKHCFSGNDVQDEAFLHFNGHTIPFVVVIDSQGVVRVVTPHVDEAEEFLNSKGYEEVR